MVVVIAAACGGSADEPATPAPADEPSTTTVDPVDEPSTTTVDSVDSLFPDVVDAAATENADGTWRFDVTLSSPYDTPERYADAWRVIAPDGTVLGVRELAHDHQFEQPFTRSLSGVEVPDQVTSVTIEGRDQRNGWGGESLEFELP